jgi:hypothetical protein
VAENYIERLDKAAANDQWCARFPATRVINGDPRHSDHRPLIITTERVPRGGGQRNCGGFRFEASWLQEEKCAAVVEEAWKAAMEVPNQLAHNALKVLAPGLIDWNHNVLGVLECRGV